jgi:hypothetical protein
MDIKDNRDLFKNRPRPAPDANAFAEMPDDSTAESRVKEPVGFGGWRDFMDYALDELVVHVCNEVKAQTYRKNKRTIHGLNRADNQAVPVQIAAEVIAITGRALRDWLVHGLGADAPESAAGETGRENSRAEKSDVR